MRRKRTAIGDDGRVDCRLCGWRVETDADGCCPLGHRVGVVTERAAAEHAGRALAAVGVAPAAVVADDAPTRSLPAWQVAEAAAAIGDLSDDAPPPPTAAPSPVADAPADDAFALFDDLGAWTAPPAADDTAPLEAPADPFDALVDLDAPTGAAADALDAFGDLDAPADDTHPLDAFGDLPVAAGDATALDAAGDPAAVAADPDLLDTSGALVGSSGDAVDAFAEAADVLVPPFEAGDVDGPAAAMASPVALVGDAEEALGAIEPPLAAVALDAADLVPPPPADSTAAPTPATADDAPLAAPATALDDPSDAPTSGLDGLRTAALLAGVDVRDPLAAHVLDGDPTASSLDLAGLPAPIPAAPAAPRPAPATAEHADEDDDASDLRRRWRLVLAGLLGLLLGAGLVVGSVVIAPI